MRTESTSQPAVLIALLTNIPLFREGAEDTIARKPSTGNLRGLCVNCDHRYECTFPRPVRGVWSCDEYV